MLQAVGKSKEKKSCAGFTLIELLVTVAVLSVMATIVFPNFSTLLARSSMSSSFNGVVAGLNYARSEAVRNREDVTVTVGSDEAGWQVAVETTDLGVIWRASEDGGNVDVQGGSLTFNALGRSSCDPKCEFVFSHPKISQDLFLEVNRMGRIGKPLSSSEDGG
ncbi:GspH/FimT family pseudopilin [Halomonas sp. 3H]|uniref:GspH/FimT family pseudopilin n=1 Tax=Halomonas sp. 3H TaxID=2952527 RepID=UPI0020B75397|nr:GspH/FimT family pseudopilin [Halomonas sp. 3H]